MLRGRYAAYYGQEIPRDVVVKSMQLQRVQNDCVGHFTRIMLLREHLKTEEGRYDIAKKERATLIKDVREAEANIGMKVLVGEGWESFAEERDG